MAIPRGFAFASPSGMEGNPVEFEKRTVTGVDGRAMCGAFVNDAACSKGVNVPVNNKPLACAGRKPGCGPNIVSNCFSNCSLSAMIFSSEGSGISRSPFSYGLYLPCQPGGDHQKNASQDIYAGSVAERRPQADTLR